MNEKRFWKQYKFIGVAGKFFAEGGTPRPLKDYQLPPARGSGQWQPLGWNFKTIQIIINESIFKNSNMFRDKNLFFLR